MKPGTWFKWYTVEGGKWPMYFYFVGMLRTADSETPIIDCEWGQRIEGSWLLDWLIPCEPGEVGKIKRKKEVKQESRPAVTPHEATDEKPKVLAAVAGDDRQNFPRLFGH